MLRDLLGSKSAEKILLFLLVHEHSYVQEICRALSSALTPLQSAMRKLERTQIVTGDVQGKKKFYRLNALHPLFPELSALLKKAFIHLPPEEKKIFFSQNFQWRNSLKDDYAKQKRIGRCLQIFWQRLTKVEKISIQTKANGQAFGNVQVIQENPGTLLFLENGSWTDRGSQELHFHNALRWSVDHTNGLIALEHLRYGPDRPVLLFHLAPVGLKTLQSIDSHLGSEDYYFGRIEFTQKHICFLWRTLSTGKNESLHYVYS